MKSMRQADMLVDRITRKRLMELLTYDPAYAAYLSAKRTFHEGCTI